MVALTLFNRGLMNQDLVRRTQISVVFIVCHALRTILKGHPSPPVLRVQAGNRSITPLPLQLCLFFPFLPGNRPTASAVGSYHILLSSCAFVFGHLHFILENPFLSSLLHSFLFVLQSSACICFQKENADITQVSMQASEATIPSCHITLVHLEMNSCDLDLHMKSLL